MVGRSAQRHDCIGKRAIITAELAVVLLAGTAAAQPVDAAAHRRWLPLKVNRVDTYSDGSAVVLRRYINGRPRFEGTTNVVSQQTISATAIKPGGISGLNLTGEGVRIGLWEVGGYPNSVHPELAGRVMFGEIPTVALSGHATHVCGTLIARGDMPGSGGFAAGASVTAWDATNDLSEMSAAYLTGLRLSNHSYSQICGFHLHEDGDGAAAWIWHGDPTVSMTEDYYFGFYDETSAAIDQVLWNNHKQLPMFTAGNNRGEGVIAGGSYWMFEPAFGLFTLTDDPRPKDGGPSGLDTIPGGMTVAKNVLTVGAIGDLVSGWVPGVPVTLSSYSGCGPTDDGRIKPDVVANGDGLYSTDLAPGGGTEPFVYGIKSGTSMAAPSVAGTLALLLELFNRGTPLTEIFGSTLKGLLIHTANDAGNTGPDYRFGWGVVNARDAASLVSAFHAGSAAAQILQGVYRYGDTFRWRVIPVGGEVRITLCYADLPGAASTTEVDPTARRLINDLDIALVQQFGTITNVYLPWVLNPATPNVPATTGDNNVDNVEQILVQVPAPGGGVSYELILSNDLYNLLFNTPYSLIVSGARLERIP